MAVSLAEEFRFGSFKLLPGQAVLLKNDEPVRLGSRATEILILLVRHAGVLVTKQEIMEEVWPDIVVVEANLSVHMSALRRALEDDDAASPYVVTVPGRGYRFAAPVIVAEQERPYDTSSVEGRSNLPLLLTRLIGRTEILDSLTRQLPRQRLTTIVGTGGVGKTALALHAAERQLPFWRDGVWVADFASLADADLVPTTLATVLGLEVRSKNPVPAIISALADKQTLLLFDNCEHVIEAVTMLANAILQSARSVAILATSRETLTIPGETVLRLEPLGVPPETELVGTREALHYAAVQLLRERVQAVDSEFELADEEALAASLICRKLGGVPLAIEFASALVPIFGLRGLSTRLDDRLRLLAGGQRTALPRHRTLHAALDWSYQLLDTSEQLALRRLAVFTGGFTIDAACAVIGEGWEEVTVAETIARLVRKSLISPDMRDSTLRFRLLETTRAFSLDALEAANEARETERRHAEYFARTLLGGGRLPPASQDYRAFTPDLDNVRAALRWAMSENGDQNLALAIGAGALPIWFGLSLLTECGARAKDLMARVDPALQQSPNAAAINVAIAATEIFTFGAPDESYHEWTERERVAADQNDLIERVRLLLGRWTYNIRMPDYKLADEQSLTLVRIAELAAKSTDAPIQDAPLAFLVEPRHLRATGFWARGTTLHHLGELKSAQASFDEFLAEETPAMREFFMAITGYERRSASLALLGSLKCLQGDVDGGLADVRLAVAEARSTGKALPLCEALQWACFTMLVVAEPIDSLEPSIDELLRTSKNHSLLSHYGVALCLKGYHAAARGSHERATEFLERGLRQLQEAHYGPFDPFFTGALAAAKAAMGQVREAWECIEHFEHTRRTHNGFCESELLRRKAILFALSGNADRAENALRTARDLAGEQNAQLWRFRAGSDLIALLHARERISDAEAERSFLEISVPEPLRRLDQASLW
jgi:predicted ATPase/DNA-binding winged helix-turn-helix (wHTH) protein